MKYFLIAMFSVVFLFAGCNQKQKPRYISNECPSCNQDTGKCNYCEGVGKCSFCNGTGIRVTKTMAVPGSGVKENTTKEKCPFCNGTGKCHYCNGTGKCSTCGGDGKVDNW